MYLIADEKFKENIINFLNNEMNSIKEMLSDYMYKKQLKYMSKLIQTM
jgi:hypothetical protein